jgi:cysteinyl-tRNA synthetase
MLLLMISCRKDEEEEEELGLTGVEKNTTVLNGVSISTWMYQIQWLDEKATIDELDATEYDMLVVEPGFNFTTDQYDMNYLMRSLKQKPNGDERILLAYIDIGQAEDYRTYWEDTWVAPTATQAGSPDFLVTIDPDGWSGNYPVAYWDEAWQKIWLGSNRIGIIEQVVNYGFDGVYLDWVEAYDDDQVREVAEEQGKNTEIEMMLFIERIRKIGKSINSEFLVVPQNAPYLLDSDPTFYSSIIDAQATEDTWFYGEGDVDWNDDDAGDLTGGDRHDREYSTTKRIAQNKKYLNLGIPVFTVDYCISEKNANKTYVNSYKNGFIPLVTRVPLTNITETPPSFD